MKGLFQVNPEIAYKGGGNLGFIVADDFSSSEAASFNF